MVLVSRNLNTDDQFSNRRGFLAVPKPNFPLTPFLIPSQGCLSPSHSNRRVRIRSGFKKRAIKVPHKRGALLSFVQHYWTELCTTLLGVNT